MSFGSLYPQVDKAWRDIEKGKLAGTKKVRDFTRKGQSKITRAERKLEKMKKKELAKQEGDLVKAGSPGRCC